MRSKTALPFNVTIREMIILSLILGLFLWIVDAVVAAFMFHEGTFPDLLLFDIPGHELIMRLLILIIFVVFGIISFVILERHKRVAVALRESEEKFHTFADFTYDWEYWISADGRMIHVSPSCERITGYRPEEFLEQPGLLQTIVHSEDKAWIVGHLAHELESRGMSYVDFRIITRDGEQRWISHCCQPVYDSNGRMNGRRASNRDISHRKRLEKELESLAASDKLTGIFNRSKLEEYLNNEVKESRRLGHPLSLMIFDVDHFKLINDTYGHDIGDVVLKMLAGTVKDRIRETDIFARWGGEEFIVLMPGSDIRGAGVLAEKLRREIGSRNFEKAGQVTVSVGVAELTGEDTVTNFLKKADNALYKAKRKGRNRVEVV
ncbi:MAG TPA: sensor domain-containing diguanylate cyclase [Thermodesulfovibrionales bacterium]|nr:sensor domain-containing diguanylate cyclase [Thermodesulfovibrionales bacterium]